MPRYSRRRFRRRRRRRYGRRKGRKNKAWISRQPRLIPDSIMVPMRVQAEFNLPDATNYLYFRANDVSNAFNGNSGSTVTRAPRFNQFMTVYSGFLVHASKISVNVQIQTPEAGTIYLYPSRAATANSDPTAAAIQPYVRWKNVMRSQAPQRSVRIASYMSSKKLEGRPLVSVNYLGSNSSSPNVLHYWHLITDFVDESGDTDYKVLVTITHFTQFLRMAPLTYDTGSAH